MERIKIDSTDVLLEDLGDGQGKIIIASPYHNFSNYWGSMGSNLSEFLCTINKYYFIDKLNPRDNGDFDGKKTMRNVRRQLSEMLPWYEFMETQKELRVKFNDMEHCSNSDEFIHRMNALTDEYWFDLPLEDEKEFNGIIDNLITECWYYIETKPSHASLFLEKLFPKLQKELKSL